MSGESPKQSRRSANERRAAAQAMRQEQLAKERRRRTLIAGGGVLVVLIVIGVLVGVGLNSDKHGGATAATTTVSQAVTTVPTSTFNSIGKGASQYPPTTVSWPTLTENGKPKILYVGAEWCPYCAAQRWVMAVALSRFGTFTHLGEVYSAADDGDIVSLSLPGSTYTSKYLVFDANEIQDRNKNNLDTLSSADEKTYSTYDPNGGFPFIDIGGKYQVSAMFDPTLLSGLSQQQIASQLKDPSSQVSQAIVGSANVLTATLCKLTGGQPTNVCSSAGVQSAA